MAYEPALVSFILAGTVGGLALVMSLSADWEVTHELARATQGWTLVMVSRTYDGADAKAGPRASKEASILVAHGYEQMAGQPEADAAVGEGAPEARGGLDSVVPGSADRIVVRFRLTALRPDERRSRG
jgi:hypothetical protein